MLDTTKILNFLKNNIGLSLGVSSSLVLLPLAYKFLQKSPDTKKQLGIVITGASKGIGFNLAKEFLEMGHKVVICSRSLENLKEAHSKVNNSKSLFYQTCDITNMKECSDFVQFSANVLGNIDIWINNAGHSKFMEFSKVETEELAKIVSSNLTGTIYCTKEVVKVMEKQVSGGHIFLMEGFGSNGMTKIGFATYGMTRYALVYLAKALALEFEGTKIGVHSFQTGLVLTDAVVTVGGGDRVPTPIVELMNVIGDRVENVAKNLAPQFVKINGNGKRLAHRSTLNYIFRFMTSPFIQWENLVSKDGKPLIKIE